MACFPAVSHGKLRYRNAEMDQIAVLKSFHGNYDSVMKVGPGSIANLQWWSEFLSSPRSRSLPFSHSSKVVVPAASNIGWVAVVHDTLQPGSRGGLFTESEPRNSFSELSLHIQYKGDLLVLFFALLSACKDDCNT